MTEAEWLACDDPAPMLEFLRGQASDRKLRLFACTRCRDVSHFFTDKRSLLAIDVAECWAELQDDVALASAHAAAGAAYRETLDKFASRLPIHATEQQAADAAQLAADHRGPSRGHRAIVANQLRHIFGNPLRPAPPLPPAVLTWSDRTIPRLADGIYHERKMPEGTFDPARLAILADALLDAGCEDEALMAHCRSEGPHVRGCWAVDLILGKE